MGEYQGNYDLNTSRKEDKITEMHMAIKAQCDFIKQLQAHKEMKNEIMKRLYSESQNQYTKKKVFAAMKYRYESFKRIQSMTHYLVNN